MLLMLVSGCGTGDDNAAVSGKDNPETVSLSNEDQTTINNKQQQAEETDSSISEDVQKTEAAQKTETEEKEEIKVTFVELGSVKCIPCKMMQPIMDEIEKEYKDQVKVVFHDVWTKEGSPYAVKYKIRIIPTQVFLDKDGKEYYRHEGFFPKEDLVKILEMQGVEL